MPDLPGAVDEPYDSCFVTWMIKNKVGGGSARTESKVLHCSGCALLKGAWPRD